MLIAGPPRNPGWRPLFARDPNPTDTPQPGPASVVVSGPSKRLLGDPGPTRIRVSPAAIRVGTPLARLRLARLPDVPVMCRLTPRAVGFKLLVKGVVGRRLFAFRGSSASALRGRGLALLSLRRGDAFRFISRIGRIGRRRRSCLLTCQGLFARSQIGLLLRERLLIGGQAFGGEPLLHFPLNLSVPVGRGLRL